MARKSKNKAEITIHSKETKILVGLTFFVVGLALFIAPFVTNQTPVFLQITEIFGVTSMVWGVAVLMFSGRIITESDYLRSNKTLIGIILLAIVSSTFFSFWIPDHVDSSTIDHTAYGGNLGFMIHVAIKNFVGKLIEFVLIVITFLISFSLLSGVGMDTIIDKIIGVPTKVIKKGQERFSREGEDIDIVDGIEQDKYTNDPTEEQHYIGMDGSENDSIDTEEFIASNDANIDSEETVVTQRELDFIQSQTNRGQETPSKTAEEETVLTPPQFPNWELPPLSLLKAPSVSTPNKEIHKRNSIVIEKTLRSFGIESKIHKITIGPTVVQYALSITVGTKVAKIRNLSNDIALALATTESQIRIEAPIPGTSLIGIEIPNPEPNFVYIKEMAEFLRMETDKFELPLILGKNIGGQCIVQDLSKLPHLLVAGATGTGKSVGINSILTGLLMTKSPDQLKLILVDPKMVEMAPYNGIAHLLTPVITDMELVVNALQWAVEEMLRRYRILKQIGTRNIAEFNKKSTDMKMPYIIIVIDEMADLMLTTGVDVESKIVRLAQMARAVGMHLILATQRPSVDVITGLIKANVPGRVAFSVSTSIDSRVIIDQTGAEALIGKGDMLFKSPSTGRPIRLQGAWTDTSDTENVVGFIKQQSDGVEYSDEVTKPRPETGKGNSNNRGGSDDFSDDDMFGDALEVVINAQKASASLLQRRLRVGYNRAARLMDELYEAGAIGPQEGSNPRTVLVTSKEQILGAAGVPDEIDD